MGVYIFFGLCKSLSLKANGWTNKELRFLWNNYALFENLTREEVNEKINLRKVK